MSFLPPLSGAILIANPSKERTSTMAIAYENRGRPLRRARALRRTKRGKKLSLRAAFNKTMKGRGYSAKQIARLYKRRRAGKTTKFPKHARRAASRRSYSRKGRKVSRKSTKRASSKRRAAPKRRKLSGFAKWLKAHKGQGLNMQMASHMYRMEKGIPTVSPMPMGSPEGYWENFYAPAEKPGIVTQAFQAVGLAPKPEEPPPVVQTQLGPVSATPNGLGWALRNGLALEAPGEFAGLALRNGVALANPLRLVQRAGGYVVGTAIPGALIVAAMGRPSDFLQENAYSKVSDLVEKVPYVGAPVASLIDASPHAITGLLTAQALALSAGALYSISDRLGPASHTAATAIAVVSMAAPVVGFVMDWEDIKDALLTIKANMMGETPAAAPATQTLAGLALTQGGEFAGLAYQQGGGEFAGLAYSQGGGEFGGPFGNALGDGMLYQTAPLTAANYLQASLADASSCGADFSVDEGSALLNGTWGAVYGAPPVRKAGWAEGTSHLAGRPGHRWGWLIQLVGWDKARAIAAMSPKQRVKLLAKLRSDAIATFNLQAAQRSVQAGAEMAANRSAAGGSTAAGGIPTAAAPGGANGASGPGELAGALFMGPA